MSPRRPPAAVLVGLSLLLSTALPAQDRAAIAAAAQRLAANPALAGGRTGIVVDDLATGERLVANDADKGFMVASNMKVIAAAVALQVLGPEFTFTTVLEAGGELRDGVLAGDLVLIGDGDPSFGAVRDGDPVAALAPLIDALQQLGVKKVAGRVIGVDDVQDDQALGEGWQHDYLHEDYAAPFGGLCFADNVATLFVAGSGSPDTPPTLRLLPDVGQIRVACDARCGATGAPSTLRLLRPPGSATVRLLGSLAADAKELALRFTIENPTRYAAAALKAALVRRGIEVVGPAIDADDIGGPPVIARRRVHAHQSPPLAELLKHMLEQSQNLWAEQLLRTAARRAPGGDGRSDQDACGRAVARALGELGVPVGGLVVADASGLSRRNLVQPAQLAGVLGALWRGPHRERFEAALPLAGSTGTLAGRLTALPARGHVRAKTGFISRVVCLSGYVDRPDAGAPPLVFSVLLNNFTCDTDDAKAAVDAFVQELAAQAGWPRQ